MYSINWQRHQYRRRLEELQIGRREGLEECSESMRWPRRREGLLVGEDHRILRLLGFFFPYNIDGIENSCNKKGALHTDEAADDGENRRRLGLDLSENIQSIPQLVEVCTEGQAAEDLLKDRKSTLQQSKLCYQSIR